MLPAAAVHSEIVEAPVVIAVCVGIRAEDSEDAEDGHYGSGIVSTKEPISFAEVIADTTLELETRTFRANEIKRLEAFIKKAETEGKQYIVVLTKTEFNNKYGYWSPAEWLSEMCSIVSRAGIVFLVVNDADTRWELTRAQTVDVRAGELCKRLTAAQGNGDFRFDDIVVLADMRPQEEITKAANNNIIFGGIVAPFNK